MDRAKHHYSLGKHRTVTADQIARNYPKTRFFGKKVFSCVECGEYVSFVLGRKVKPHFKHWKKNKTTIYCTLRSRSLQSDSIYEKLGLPLYLRRRGKDRFELYLGFYSLDGPQMDLARRENLKITITPFDGDERLSIHHIVNPDKFPLGSTKLIRIGFASNRYKIKYSSSNAAKSIIPRWGSDAEGILEGGSLFVYGPGGGRKIRVNDEVRTDIYYYYLSRGLSEQDGLEYEKKGEVALQSGQSHITYGVYKIRFKRFNEQQFKTLAEFCKETLKVNLVSKPTSLTPLWPPVIYKGDELNYSERESEALLILQTEEKNPEIFIHTGSGINETKGTALGNRKYIVTLPIHKQRMAVTINERYGTIHSFFAHYQGSIRTSKNKLTIKDMDDNPIKIGIHNDIPPKRKIKILSNTRCDVVRVHNYQIRSETRVKDKNGVLVRDIAYGDDIVVLLGSDIIPLISFRKPVKNNQTMFDHRKLYLQLKKMGPPFTVPPVWLKELLKKIRTDTKLFGLLKGYVFTNAMPAKAYHVLAHAYDTEEESDREER